MNKNNVGKIHITVDLVESDPEQAAKVLAMLDFVPLRVECMWQYRRFEYVGLSPKFPELKEGLMVPTYIITVNVDGDGEITSVRADLGSENSGPLTI